MGPGSECDLKTLTCPGGEQTELDVASQVSFEIYWTWSFTAKRAIKGAEK